jgi:hypothetical protein
MLKTPLPEKLYFDQYTPDQLTATINQLITYLAELTEVVEGRQSLAELNILVQEKQDKQWREHTLKEQLLGEIAELPRVGVSNFVHVSDVESIINRLIP